MAERIVKVQLDVGLRARAGASFVEVASESESDVSITKVGGYSADAKSILSVLGLEVSQGDTVIIESSDQEIVDRLVIIATSAQL